MPGGAPETFLPDGKQHVLAAGANGLAMFVLNQSLNGETGSVRVKNDSEFAWASGNVRKPSSALTDTNLKNRDLPFARRAPGL